MLKFTAGNMYTTRYDNGSSRGKISHPRIKLNSYPVRLNTNGVIPNRPTSVLSLSSEMGEKTEETDRDTFRTVEDKDCPIPVRIFGPFRSR